MDLNVYNDKTQSGGVEISFIGSMNDKTQYGWDQNVVHRGYERQNTEWRGSKCRSSWV
ncbi:hypothetical protein [Metabacillus litoralis]|uniref:hypothetical protein n=1 Tax=Metabacillus litoralis TaxID=152268 RepID=UPI00203FACEE|nr:hypothetical protein [Metabacillus litoralis]MCM3412999.1 hypothetical protein [Metabacillus litoralis]